MDLPPANSPVERSKGRGLPWFPLATAFLAIASVIYIHSLPEFERNLKSWLTAGIPLLAGILILIWFLLTKRFSGRSRLIGLAVVILLSFIWKASVRVDGTVDGRGMPKLVWKWSTTRLPAAKTITPQLAAGDTSLPTDPRLSQAADVPQFFGPMRNGIAPTPNLSGDWQTQPPKELWRQPIGTGWSAFAVVSGLAYTQEQRGEEELVTCYELLTGKLLWAHADKAKFTQWQGGEGPRATPTVMGGRVYSIGATGLLNCLESTTGKPIWKRSVLTENKLENIEWGISASPLIVDDRVIVSGGNPRGPVLFAYDRNTGSPIWKTGDDQANYSSPLLTTLAGKRLILCNNVRALSAFDPANGAVLFDYPWGGEKFPKASQPVVVSENRVFISAGYGMGCKLLEVTAGPDGALSITEVWSGMKMKTQFNSPALLNGHLYGLDDGRLACLDVATGERLWKEGRFASGQSLLAGNHIIVQSEIGPVHLCAAAPGGFKELGKLSALSSKTWNHPVLAGRFLIVRNDREAVCYELPTVP
jgi:outer membrane protein assembly factor BamB